jgi:branched-chain amino acid transport system permease protein
MNRLEGRSWSSLPWWALPLVFAVTLALLPALGLSSYLIGVFVAAFALTSVGVTFNLVYGYLGLLSLGHVAFWGVGAYGTALALVDLQLDFWVAVLVGAALAGVFATVVGLALLRLPGGAFAIASLAVLLMLQIVAKDWTEVTRGSLGIPGLPAPSLRLGDLHLMVDSSLDFYYLFLLLGSLVAVGVYKIVSSRVGMTLVAIRENEALAESQGIDTFRYKLVTYVFSAAITGAFGGLFVSYLSVVDPSILGIYFLQITLLVVIVGGKGTYWPVIVAGVLLPLVPELLRVASSMRLASFGLILIGISLYLPQGVGGWLAARRSERQADAVRQALERPQLP